MKTKAPSNFNRTGFTLLEVVIALGLMGMLVGMIFRVAQSSMMLSQTVVEKQTVTMERNAFFNLLKHHFGELPGNAVIRLESKEAASKRRLFNLIFQNVPMSFTWGDVPITAEAVELATVEQRDGFIDVVMRFYDEKILEGKTSTGEEAKPVAEITLIEDLALCECEVVDGRGLENPLREWDNNRKLPLLVKFYCRFEPDADIVQQTFWIVPKQNPDFYMQQLRRENSAGGGVRKGNQNPSVKIPNNSTNSGGVGPQPNIKLITPK